MEDFHDDDDDFGDLYDDVELRAGSAIDAARQMSDLNSIENDIHENAIENCEDDFSYEQSNAGHVNLENATAKVASVVAEAEMEMEEEVEEEEEEEGSSESEDDLKIVLNDDVGDGDVEVNPKISNNYFNNRLGFGEVANEEGNERCGSGTELASNGGAGSERGKGVLGGYNSRYKNMRFHKPAFGSNLNGNGSAGVASYSRAAVRGDWENDVYVHGGGLSSSLSSLASQNGCNFSLPRSMTILDVNIDIFEQKRWSHPDADITDFFNFGFDEDSWKHYCNLLDKYREQTVKASRTCSRKSSRHYMEREVGYQNEVTHEAVGGKQSYSMQQHPELINGRTIHVEDCIFERQPSIDIRHSLDRDPDVIIQIAVQDFVEDCLTSAKEGVDRTETVMHRSSEKGNDGADETRDIPCSGSANKEQLLILKGLGEGSGNSLPERRTPASGSVSVDSVNCGSVHISDSDERHDRDWSNLDGNAEAVEASDGTGESMEKKTYDAAASVVEPESSSHRLISPSCCSHFVQPKTGAYADLRETQRQSNMVSPSSMSEFRESVSYDNHPSKDSKSHGVKTKPRAHRVDAWNRSPMWNDLNYNRKRHIDISELKSQMGDEDASYLSDAEGFYDTRHSTVNHKKQKNGQHDIDSFDRHDDSYHEGSETFVDYRDKKICNHNHRDGYMKSQHWKWHSSFDCEMDQSHRQNINRKQFHLEHRASRMGDKEARQDFYYHQRRYSLHKMESLTSQESRKWTLKYDHYQDSEERNRWKRRAEDWQFTKRGKNDDFLPESHYKTDLMREKYKKPLLNHDKDFLQCRSDKCLLYNRRGYESPRRSCGFDNIWEDYEDEKGISTGRLALSSASCKRPLSVNRPRWLVAESPKRSVYKSHGRSWRNIQDDRSYNYDRLANFDDSVDTDENIIKLDGQDSYVRTKEHEQSEVSHWNVKKYNSRHWNNKLRAEEASYPFERISGPRRFDTQHGSHHVTKLIDPQQVSWGRFKLRTGRRRGSQYCQNSEFIHGDNHVQSLPRCWDSVDSHLVGADRKSAGRNFEAGNMYYDRYEYMDCNSGLKSVKKAEKLIVDRKSKGENWQGKVSDAWRNDSQDIEEGQIITEEENEETTEKMSSSGDTALVGDKKNPLAGNAVAGIVAFERQENPRILELIAKMEKRRERFKQPITEPKGVEKKTPQALVDTVVETLDTKPQKPARKRRWGGS